VDFYGKSHLDHDELESVSRMYLTPCDMYESFRCSQINPSFMKALVPSEGVLCVP
jgi:hypothetical protein